jgi:hypothetical protein
MPDIAQPFVTSASQGTNSVLMIRPSRFYPNPETAADNAFQRRAGRDVDTLTGLARTEFDTAVQTLCDAGVRVHVFEDTPEPEKPDAVFPNTGFQLTTMDVLRCSQCIQRCDDASAGTISSRNCASIIA